MNGYRRPVSLGQDLNKKMKIETTFASTSVDLKESTKQEQEPNINAKFTSDPITATSLKPNASRIQEQEPVINAEVTSDPIESSTKSDRDTTYTTGDVPSCNESISEGSDNDFEGDGPYYVNFYGDDCDLSDFDDCDYCVFQ
jgi:hypothetical protein